MTSSRSFSLTWRSATALALILAGLPAACSGGGGGGGIPSVITEDETPPNDTAATANVVPVGTPVQGDVATIGDIDYFKITLGANQVVCVDLHATRRDQAAWDAGDNVPHLTLLDTDGTSALQEHAFSGPDGWGSDWGKHDFGIPWFLVPAAGDYYVRVEQDDPGSAGGAYVMRAHYITVAGLQEEAEPTGTSGANDTDNTAEAIVPGTVHGFHVAGDLDYYSFTVAAPSIVRFEAIGYRNGMCQGDTDYLDPSLHLYDVDGTTELFFNEDGFFYDPAIQALILVPGTYFITVDEYPFGSGEGEYALAFTSTSFSATAEDELPANDTFLTANPIAYGGRVSGTMETLSGDVDFFSFSGAAGDIVRVQVFDLHNSVGLGVADDIVASFVGTDGSTVLPSGGDGELQTLTVILRETGTFYVRVDADNSPMALAEYALELTRFKTATFETEPNGTTATANVAGARAAGVIDPALDVDVYQTTFSANELVSVACYASSTNARSNGSFELAGHGSQCQPVVEILDGTGAVVATSDHGSLLVGTEDVVDALPVVAVTYVPTAAGTYYVRVTDTNGAGGPNFSYVIEKK